MTNFQDLILIPNIKRRLKELQFEELFPIQEEAMHPVLEGKDVIGQAKTGTGKTAAYAIPIVERLRQKDEIQALIIVPTRELAQQVERQFEDIGKYTPFHFSSVFGGASIDRQITEIAKAQVVIGTPGRLIDHLSRGTLSLEKTRTLVIDEADRLLDMGFIDDVRYIISHIPRERQTCMFSATMPEEIIQLAQTSMHNPIKILVDRDEISVEGIEQLYCLVERRRKYRTLLDLLKQFYWRKILIFVDSRRQADWLTLKLNKTIRTQKLHGGLPQSRRNAVMRQFLGSGRNVIVATDLAARGLDVEGIDCVINYDMPLEPLTYFHRIGRTGRAGKAGTAISIVSYEDGPILAAVKSLTKIQPKELSLGGRKFGKWEKGVMQNPLVESIY